MPTKQPAIRAVDLADVLAYLVVLGLFVQFFPAVISESFTLRLLTAILMKLALEVITWAKKRALTTKRMRGPTCERRRPAFAATGTTTVCGTGSRISARSSNGSCQ